MAYDYNIVSIGAGSGGLVASLIGAGAKAKCALIEKHKMGGDCLNTGCVPSKALIRSASFMAHLKKHKEFGIKEASASFDFADVMDRVHSKIAHIEPHDSVERFTKEGVDCFITEGKIKSPHEIEVDGKIITTKNIIIATGARPFVPPIEGINDIDYLTSDNLWELRELPERLVVLGGGPIGSEMAQAFARLGSTVTQVERGSRIMAREDDDICDYMATVFRNDGIDLRLNSNAVKVKKRGNDTILTIEKDGQKEEIACDKVLCAVGRTPNTSGFGLEEIGVKLGPRGHVEVNGYAQTNIPNIWACGDVASKYQFTHTASHMAWYATFNAMFGTFKKFTVDWSIVPWVTYTDPEVARVGLNEREAKEQHIDYELSEYGIDDLDRAIADSENHGKIKVLTKPGSDEILGVTICGYHGGDLLPEFVLAMKKTKRFSTRPLGLKGIVSCIHSYPTMSEANKFAGLAWQKAHIPKWIFPWLIKYQNWQRK